MSSAPQLSIIIVSYNTQSVLRDCIESLYKTSKETFFELIIVDNNSRDETKPYLDKLKRRNLRIIKNNHNAGFAKAANQGIRLSKGKRILLLNSDTLVSKNVLSQLNSFSKKYNDQSILAPRLLNKNKTIQPSCYHFPTIWRAISEFWLGKVNSYTKYAPQTTAPAVVDAAVGAALLIPRKVINKVGLFSEKFFMYYEDIEYCHRAKRKGIRVVYLPSVRIVHLHGESGKKLSSKPGEWLIKSSKKYNGLVKHYLINFVIWTGQKWQRKKSS